MKIVDFEKIRALNIPLSVLYSWTQEVWEKQDLFILPAKTHIWLGESGRFMVMPSILPSEDVAGVKFISRNVDSWEAPPKRNSNIMIQKISEHGLYALMDGTWITTMRTGACAYYHALHFSKTEPSSLSIYGLGLAARAFMLFWYELYKKPITVKLLPYKDQHISFMNRFPENNRIKYELVDKLEDLLSSDIIVSSVSFSRRVLFENTSIYKPGCCVIPIHTSGFQNCDLVFDKVFVDDVDHVKAYRYFEQFKSRMFRITDYSNGKVKGREDNFERIIVYNGGLATFDLFWAIKILRLLEDESDHCVYMSYPKDRFWI